MKFKQIVKYLDINARIAEYGTLNGILKGPDCISVTFYRTYLLHNIEHRVEVCIPSLECPSYYFEDFNGEYTENDYDNGIVIPDCWSKPTEADLNSEWTARIVWFGDEYFINDEFKETVTEDANLLYMLLAPILAKMNMLNKVNRLNNYNEPEIIISFKDGKFIKSIGR